MFRFQKSVGLFLFSSLLLAACKSTTDKSGIEVAAKVGSAEITLKRVDSTVKQQLDASRPMERRQLHAERCGNRFGACAHDRPDRIRSHPAP